MYIPNFIKINKVVPYLFFLLYVSYIFCFGIDENNCVYKYLEPLDIELWLLEVIFVIVFIYSIPFVLIRKHVASYFWFIVLIFILNIIMCFLC